MIQKKYIDVKLLEVQKKMENTEPESLFGLKNVMIFFLKVQETEQNK